MMDDPEVKAMAGVVAAVDGLEEEAIERVIKWAVQRFKVSIAGSVAKSGLPAKKPTGASGTDTDDVPEERPAFENFHDLFDAANPTTAPEKALVAGYWFQVLGGQEDLDSGQMNRALKNLGHPSTNITRDLDVLISRNPRQVIQVRKGGKTKQARKRYKLTREGIKTVEKMLNKEE